MELQNDLPPNKFTKEQLERAISKYMKSFRQELIDIFWEEFSDEIDQEIDIEIHSNVTQNIKEVLPHNVVLSLISSVYNDYPSMKQMDEANVINLLNLQYLSNDLDVFEFWEKDREKLRRKTLWMSRDEILNQLEIVFRRIRYHNMYIKWHRKETCPFEGVKWMAGAVFLSTRNRMKKVWKI